MERQWLWYSRNSGRCNLCLVVEISGLMGSDRGWKCGEFLWCRWWRLKVLDACVLWSDTCFRKVTVKGRWNICNRWFSFFSSLFFHCLISPNFLSATFYSLSLVSRSNLTISDLLKVCIPSKKSSIHRRECLNPYFQLHSLNISLLLLSSVNLSGCWGY